MDKLSLVHPVVTDRVRQLFAALKGEGYDFIVTQARGDRHLVDGSRGVLTRATAC